MDMNMISEYLNWTTFWYVYAFMGVQYCILFTQATLDNADTIFVFHEIIALLGIIVICGLVVAVFWLPLSISAFIYIVYKKHHLKELQEIMNG